MKRRSSCAEIAAVAVFCFLLCLAATPPVWGHCDTLDGPVVMSAREALDAGDVTPVLKWVKKEHEAEIRTAFDKTVSVRVKGPSEKQLADMYFFETLVRIHRAGEGEPYTGLKPAGHALSPAIPAVDRAIAEGNADALSKLLTGAMQKGLEEKFRTVMVTKNFNKSDTEAGREYVAAYVAFMHYVEGMYQAAMTGAHVHHGEAVHSVTHEAE